MGRSSKAKSSEGIKARRRKGVAWQVRGVNSPLCALPCYLAGDLRRYIEGYVVERAVDC